MIVRTKAILYVSNSLDFVGGAERSLFELLKNLDRTRVTPYFASIHNGELASKIRSLDIQTLHVHSFSKRNPLSFLKSCIALTRFMVKNQIDFVHNNRAIDTFYSYIPAKITSTPLIIHNRDSSFSKLEKILIKQAHYNICISNWQKQEYFDHNAILIHNGLDLQQFQPLETVGKTDEKSFLGYSNDDFVVGMFSRISPIKGQAVLIHAAKTLAEAFPQIKYVIAGQATSEKDKQYEIHLKMLIRDYGLEERFRFTGYIEHVWHVVSAFDVVAMPSTREPFGRTAIEAMYLAKPVICTNTGGFTDIVTPDTGVLIPVDDPTALSKAIRQLYNASELRRKMGQAGKARVIKEFTIQNTVEKLHSLYDNIAVSNKLGAMK